MKKAIVLLALVLTSTVSFAQGIDLGIKAGVNFASITDATGLDNRTGFVVGAFAGAKFNDKVGIQGDLLYSQQGAEFDGGEFNLDYVNVPVVIKYFLVQGLNIQAGPQFGFVAKDDVKSDLGDISEGFKTNSFDLSGVVGVGYDLPMGVRIDGRYNFGLSDVFDVAGAEGKNTVITLSVGYSFL